MGLDVQTPRVGAPADPAGRYRVLPARAKALEELLVRARECRATIVYVARDEQRNNVVFAGLVRNG